MHLVFTNWPRFFTNHDHDDDDHYSTAMPLNTNTWLHTFETKLCYTHTHTCKSVVRVQFMCMPIINSQNVWPLRLID